MKRLPMFVLAGFALAFSAQAHATSSPDPLVNGINTLVRGRSGGVNAPVFSPQVGGGGGTPIGSIPTPENPTLILAMLCGVGLLVGSKLNSARSTRLPVETL